MRCSHVERARKPQNIVISGNFAFLIGAHAFSNAKVRLEIVIFIRARATLNFRRFQRTARLFYNYYQIFFFFLNHNNIIDVR